MEKCVRTRTMVQMPDLYAPYQHGTSAPLRLYLVCSCRITASDTTAETTAEVGKDRLPRASGNKELRQVMEDQKEVAKEARPLRVGNVLSLEW
mmetsp:Transcript_121856/g.389683  ORF Transcript_121856/g.389683 Transcript_121856/m.389683 type:complete len:93 (+) Transcript_121856:3-281(+)